MKITYRGNCFETNSSSMHSIIITKNDAILSEEEIKKLFWRNKLSIDIDDDDFGRYPFRLLTTVKDKIAYAIASYCGYADSHDINDFLENLEDIITEKYPAFKGFDFNNVEFHDVYEDEDGNEIPYEDLEYAGDGKYTYRGNDGREHQAIPTDNVSQHPVYGSIDHQSLGLLQNFLRDKNISLSDFIFNKKYVVVIDGDEYCKLQELIDSGLISKEDIIENYNKYSEDDYYDNSEDEFSDDFDEEGLEPHQEH